MSTRQSYPITDADLDKWIPQAEAVLRNINARDIEQILRDLSPAETFRTLPEEMFLLFRLRHSTCMFFHIFDVLAESMGQKKDVSEARVGGGGATPLYVQEKSNFIITYAIFVMANNIVNAVSKELRGKNLEKMPQANLAGLKIDVGGGVRRDLASVLNIYADTLLSQKSDGTPLINEVAGMLVVTKDYWQAVAQQLQSLLKRAKPEFLAHVEMATFKHNKFAISGLSIVDVQEARVVTWKPTTPEEVIGDEGVTLTLARQCDRLACYDPNLQKNPFAEFGAMLESTLIDGPPGTGKTTRFRMMMTRIAKRAEQVGVPCVFKSVTADQVKNEWYGKSAQLIAQLLEAVKDPQVLALMCVDDIDLLLTGDRGASGTSGADLDILKALMDFFSGTGTDYMGNYLTVAATNKPTATEDALRQRFVYRAIIDGPKSRDEYVRLVAQELKGFAKTGRLKVGGEVITPKIIGKGTLIFPEDITKRFAGKGGNWNDIGALCAELRMKDAKFTGRSVKNALQVAIAQAADFDVPEAWFTDPQVFRLKSWDERLGMIKELFADLSADRIMMALEYQAQVERRYAEEALEKQIQERARELMIHMEAAGRFGTKESEREKSVFGKK